MFGRNGELFVVLLAPCVERPDAVGEELGDDAHIDVEEFGEAVFFELSGGDVHIVDGAAEGRDGEVAEIGEHLVALPPFEDEHIFELGLVNDAACIGGSYEHDVFADIPCEEAVLTDEVAEVVSKIAAFRIDEFTVVGERFDVEIGISIPFACEVVILVEGVEELVSLRRESFRVYNSEDGFEIGA